MSLEDIQWMQDLVRYEVKHRKRGATLLRDLRKAETLALTVEGSPEDAELSNALRDISSQVTDFSCVMCGGREDSCDDSLCPECRNAGTPYAVTREGRIVI